MAGGILRLLELVQRELDADDARLEIGGRDPDDGRVVWHRLPSGWRIVALFAEAPKDRPATEERLARFAESFSGVIQPAAPESRGYDRHQAASHHLDDELEALAARAGAMGCVVVDDKSPVLWGTSEPRRDGSDVDGALRLANWAREAHRFGVDLVELLQNDEETLPAHLERLGVGAAERETLITRVAKLRERGRRSAAAWRRQLCVARAIEKVRENKHDHGSRVALQEDGLGVLSRGFANIYHLVLAFSGAYSELQAEGALVHTLPLIEKLVLSLPPVDPEPGARVIRLPRPS